MPTYAYDPNVKPLTQAELDQLAADQAAMGGAVPAGGYDYVPAAPVEAAPATGASYVPAEPAAYDLAPAGTPAPPTTTVAYPSAGPGYDVAPPYDYGTEIPSSTPVPEPAQGYTTYGDPSYIPPPTGARSFNEASMYSPRNAGASSQYIPPPEPGYGLVPAGTPAPSASGGPPDYSGVYPSPYTIETVDNGQRYATSPLRSPLDEFQARLGGALGLDPNRQDLDMYNQFVMNTRDKWQDVGQGLMRFPQGAKNLITTPLDLIRGATIPQPDIGLPEDPFREEWQTIEDAVGPWGLYPRGAQEAGQNYITDPVAGAVTALRDLAGGVKDTYLDEPTAAWQAGPGEYFDRSFEEQLAAVEEGRVPPGETSKLQATEDAATAAIESVNTAMPMDGMPTQGELENASMDVLSMLMTEPGVHPRIKEEASVIVGRRAAQQAGTYDGPLLSIPTPDLTGAGEMLWDARRAVGESPNYQYGVPEQVSNVPPPYYNAGAPPSQAMPEPEQPLSTNLGAPAQPRYDPLSGAFMGDVTPRPPSPATSPTLPADYPVQEYQYQSGRNQNAFAPPPPIQQGVPEQVANVMAPYYSGAPGSEPIPPPPPADPAHRFQQGVTEQVANVPTPYFYEPSLLDRAQGWGQDVADPAVRGAMDTVGLGEPDYAWPWQDEATPNDVTVPDVSWPDFSGVGEWGQGLVDRARGALTGAASAAGDIYAAPATTEVGKMDATTASIGDPNLERARDRLTALEDAGVPPGLGVNERDGLAFHEEPDGSVRAVENLSTGDVELIPEDATKEEAQAIVARVQGQAAAAQKPTTDGGVIYDDGAAKGTTATKTTTAPKTMDEVRTQTANAAGGVTTSSNAPSGSTYQPSGNYQSGGNYQGGSTYRGGGSYQGGGNYQGGGGYSGGSDYSSESPFSNPIFDRFVATVAASNPAWLDKIMNMSRGGSSYSSRKGKKSKRGKSSRRGGSFPTGSFQSMGSRFGGSNR